MNTQLPPDSSQRRRHYIVVVHGMGEQKTNVTAPAVVERFAEARQKTGTKQDSDSPNINFIIPANLSEQSVRNDGIGHGWAEFEGIPVSKDTDYPKFNGSISTDTCTNNFRFVDIAWQFILKEDIENFGSPTEEWTTALLEKLELRKNNEKNQRNERPIPPWVLPMLRSIVNTAIPIKKMLAFKYADLTRFIFDGFLGDVHLYGDYGRTRGRAVRHFHAVLDEIMIRDFMQWYWVIRKQNPEQHYLPPEFTIIAHSLGSIMSFDALVYSHIKDEIRNNDYGSKNWPASLPFPGYDFIHEEEKKNWNYLHQKLRAIWDREQDNSEIRKNIAQLIPNATELFNRTHEQTNNHSSENGIPSPNFPYLSWRDHITNYITLGSPIDKFFVLWPEKYTHLKERKENQEEWLEPSVKINHYNFCDEQDPVGHHLEEVMSTQAYKTLFNTDPAGNHDVVFRRYGIPGFAHIKYFNDKKLFLNIIEHIIDKNTDNKNNTFIWKEIHENEKAYKSAKRWAYYLIPFFAVLATTALVSYGMMNESLLWRVAAFVGALLLWIQPNLLTAYRDEIGNNREMEKSWFADKWNKIRPVRGILSRLVSAAIEWRRILIVENLGPNKTDDPEERIAFQNYDWQGMFYEPLKEFFWFIGILLLYLLSGFLAVAASYFWPLFTHNYTLTPEIYNAIITYTYTHPLTILLSIFSKNSIPPSNAVIIIIIFTSISALVRLYVSFSFLKAWILCQVIPYDKQRNSSL